MAKACAFDLRRGASSRRRGLFSLALAGALLGAAPAAAQDLCAGLRRAMAEAGRDFAPLRIAGEVASAHGLPARTLLPDGNRCELRETARIVEYRCRMTRIDAASSEARAVYRKSVARVRRCFAGLMPRGYGDYTAAKDWTGAVIWEPRRGVRAAVVFVAADEIALAAGTGEEPPEETNAVWIVVDKRKR